MVLAPAVQVLLGLLIVSALMTVLWFVQRRTGNAGIVDAGWAASIGLLGIFYATTSDGYLPRRVLVAVLIGIWSARLAIYILLDRVLGHPEEGRYRTLREAGERRPGEDCSSSFRIRPWRLHSSRCPCWS